MKTILVTGATDGIGKETVRLLRERGARVIVHGRTLEKAKAVQRDDVVFADLASLDEVRALARQVKDVLGGATLDVLVNNAGTYQKKRTLTPDGRELTMAVNHDAPVLLTHLLVDELRRAPQGRVVNVSSIAHGRGRIDLDDIDMARGFDGYGAYSASKLANVLFTVELARRLRGTKVTVNALHPGVVSTKLLHAGFGMGGPDSHEEGAATSVFLALDDVKVSGRYFVRCTESAPSNFARDTTFCRRFYEESCRRVGTGPLPA